MKTTLYIVRHGQSEANIDPNHPTDDPMLTEAGRMEIRQVAEELRLIEFTAAYSSHLKRAKETASIIIGDRDIAHFINEELREQEYGTLYNKPQLETEWKALEEKWKELGPDEHWDYRAYEGMETHREALDRFVRAMNIIAHKHPGETVLVVAHGAVMRMFFLHTGYAKYHQVLPGAIKNGGYAISEYEDGHFQIIKAVGFKGHADQVTG